MSFLDEPAEFKKPRPQSASFDTLQRAFKQYQDPADRFLAQWLYLSGQRVTEAIKTKRSDVELQTIRGQRFMMVDSLTEKNKQNVRRKIPIPMFGFEQEMAEAVWSSIENLKPEVRLVYFTRQTCFNHLNKVSIPCNFIHHITNERFEGVLPLYPHFLRHCRASHMHQNHGFQSLDSMQFFGWSSDAMPNLYITGSGKNLAEGFIHE